MAENPEHSAGDGDKAEPEASRMPPNEYVPANGSGTSESAQGATSGSDAVVPDLPFVESPGLGGDDGPVPSAKEDESSKPPPVLGSLVVSEPPHQAKGSTDRRPGSARRSRLAVMAASLALAASLGSFIGTMSAAGLAQMLRTSTPAPGPAEEFAATAQSLKAQFAELSALKASLDTATRGTASQLAKIAERLDHLDKRAASAADVTGSIGSSASSASTPPPAPAPLAAEPPLPVLNDWIVQDVQNGRALVASHVGGIFDVGAGSILPGLGRVESIKRQDGQWVVVTSRGAIVSRR
jgi:hypothetical protein